MKNAGKLRKKQSEKNGHPVRPLRLSHYPLQLFWRKRENVVLVGGARASERRL